MKTIRELSLELGISKTYLIKIIRQHGLQSDLKKDGNKFLVPETVENEVKSAFKEKKRNTESSTEYANRLQSEVDYLRLELTNKNEEIRTLHKLLDQQQQLTLKNNNQIEQLKIELEENDVRKLSFWNRIFHKKES